MKDYNKLAKALISAFQASTNAEKAFNNSTLLNTQQSQANQANASGTLYSTGLGFKQAQAASATQQANARLDANFLTNKLNVQSSILDTKYKIDAMNRAAKQLDKVKFYV